MRHRTITIKVVALLATAVLSMFMLAGCGGGAVGAGEEEFASSAVPSSQSVDLGVDEADNESVSESSSVGEYPDDYPEGYEEFLKEERQNALEQDMLNQYNNYQTEEIERAYEEYQREQSKQNSQGDGPFGW